MQVTLKQDSPEKQRKTMENFIRRQEAHQRKRENLIKIKVMEQDRSLSGKPKTRSTSANRVVHRSKSPGILSTMHSGSKP